MNDFGGGAMEFTADVLRLDSEAEVGRIAEIVRTQVLADLRRRGVVVGLSGGVDSSVVAALCVRALGAERVFGLLMPEKESETDSLRLGRTVADGLGIRTAVEDVGPVLEAAGCYRRRDEAIRSVIPEYTEEWRSKLVLSRPTQGAGFTVFLLELLSPDGDRSRVRLPVDAYLAVVAATNFKQRVRKMFEYHHADRLNYAVAGTPNRLEFDQGFFVKGGDGSADLKPIAHLYKTQVYQLAEWLGLPREVRERPSTTDTFSLPQSQEEFFFSVPLGTLDLCLYGLNHGVPAERVAGVVGMAHEDVDLIFKDIESKRQGTRYLHRSALLVEEVLEE